MDVYPDIFKIKEEMKMDEENEKYEGVKVKQDHMNVASILYDRCKNDKEPSCETTIAIDAYTENGNNFDIVRVKTENVDTEKLDIKDNVNAVDADIAMNSAVEEKNVLEKPGFKYKLPPSGMCGTETMIDFHFLSGFGLNCNQTDKKVLQCNFCTYTTHNKSTLRNHVLIQHKEPKEWYKCKSCNYETHVRSNLTKHVTAMHTSNYTKYTCERCNKVFKEKKALDDHIVKSYPALISLVLSKIHSCPICSFKTTYKNNLSQHMLIHTKDNAAAYKCTNCDYTTYRKSDVMKHLKIHSKVKEYRCTGCNKEFGRKDHLDEHIIRQHKDNNELTKSVNKKISECGHCNYRTTKVTSLRKHEKAHHS